MAIRNLGWRSLRRLADWAASPLDHQLVVLVDMFTQRGLDRRRGRRPTPLRRQGRRTQPPHPGQEGAPSHNATHLRETKRVTGLRAASGSELVPKWTRAHGAARYNLHQTVGKQMGEGAIDINHEQSRVERVEWLPILHIDMWVDLSVEVQKKGWRFALKHYGASTHCCSDRWKQVSQCVCITTSRNNGYTRLGR